MHPRPTRNCVFVQYFHVLKFGPCISPFRISNAAFFNGDASSPNALQGGPELARGEA
jgi:hypothetical protein